MTKVLIVEDDPMISEIYNKKFKDAGFEVSLAMSGKEVLKVLAKDTFDIALVDMVMPGLSGLEVLEELNKGNYNVDNMRIIMCSNLSDKENQDKAMELGADGYIIKTQYSPSELVDEVQKRLKEFAGHKKVWKKAVVADVKKNKNGKKILLVEDEAVFSEMFGKELEGAGYEVTYAHNGALGLKEALVNDFNLIIMDMVMPSMTGQEMLAKLKLDDKTKNIPVIVLSASLNEDEQKEVEKIGISGFYIKTKIVPEELSKKVGELLN
jgi:DNA-binding response OmpR family regulator